MPGIVINIDPVIFHIGDVEIRWYSVAIILAVIAATVIAAREGRRKGLSTDFIYSLAPVVMLSGLVGARLFHVVDRWDYYSANPLQIFQVQQGGLAIWGGLFVGGVTAVIFARMSHVPAGRLVDTLVPALLAAQIIGRVGCIINGDAYGGLTSLPWGFVYMNPHALIPARFFGVPTHPYPVYEMLWNGASLLLLLKIRRGIRQDGFLFFSYLALYSLGRFGLTFVRQETATFLGLQQAQVIAVLILTVSAGLLAYLSKRGQRPATVEAET